MSVDPFKDFHVLENMDFGVDMSIPAPAPAEEEVVETETEVQEIDPTEADVEDTAEVDDSDDTVEDTDEDLDEDDDTESANDIIGVFAEHLSEKGIIDIGEDTNFDDISSLETVIQDKISSEIEAYKEGLPDIVSKLTDFIDSGGDPHRFLEATLATPDLSNLDLDKEEAQVKVVKEWLKIQGETADEIDETIEDFEDAGLLAKRAAKYHKRLMAHKEQEKQNLVKAQKQDHSDRRAAYDNYLSEVKTTVESAEEIAGIPITKKEKKDFYTYFTEPLNERGETKYALDLREDPVDNSVKLAYFLYKGFNFKNIEAKATTKAANKLQDRLTRFAGKKATGMGARGNKKSRKIDTSGNFKTLYTE
jgi:hypothetical protein